MSRWNLLAVTEVFVSGMVFPPTRVPAMLKNYPRDCGSDIDHCTMRRRDFESAVRDAIETLPEEFENVAIVVKDEPDEKELRALGVETETDELFGLYHGVPLTERGSGLFGLPDRIEIYSGPILRSFDTVAEIVAEIRNTVIHELGHHMGLTDSEMPY